MRSAAFALAVLAAIGAMPSGAPLPEDQQPTGRAAAPTHLPTPWAGLCAVVLLFIALAWPFLQKLGIEVDEAMIANGIYERASAWYSWHLFGNEIPVMLITYLGALKTWFFNPIFAIWAPGPISLRLPMLLIAAVTLVILFALLDRTLGRAIAWFATLLLATDPSFILVESIDFGFVTFQHAFKLTALLLLVLFHRKPSALKLAGAFFLFGLAMWDKAVFSWVLSALVIAGAAVFWREIREHLTLRNLLTAGGGFVVGALPLIIYNVARPLETLTASAHFSLEGALVKVVLLKRTLDGSGLFGFFTALDTGPHPGNPHSVVQHVAFWLGRATGFPTTTLTAIALLCAIAALPLLWRTPVRRGVVFSLLVMLITWLQMFFTTGAGGAVHHAILLWPFQMIVIAAAAVQLARRFERYTRHALLGMALLLCGSQALVVNQFLVSLIHNGTSVRWTDAFGPLENYLYNSRAERIVTGDWGILETLNLLSEGELPVEDASVFLRPSSAIPDREARVIERIKAEKLIWVLHSATREEWLGVNAELDRLAGTAGYSKELLHTVRDRNGRAIFDIIRFRRA